MNTNSGFMGLIGRRERAEQILKLRRFRDALFDEATFGEPAWDILLTLYVEEQKGRYLSVSKICGTVGVPPTTALRHLTVMTEQGLIIRTPDPDDARRVYVQLANHTIVRIEQVLESSIIHW